MTPSAAASIAAHESWAHTADRSARSATGARGLRDRFTREARERLGEDATDRQVADAADSALKAHYRRLGQASAEARRRAS